MQYNITSLASRCRKLCITCVKINSIYVLLFHTLQQRLENESPFNWNLSVEVFLAYILISRHSN